MSPPRVRPGELARALGGESPVAAVRERALHAVPTVAAWELELELLDAAGRSELLRRADEIARHQFDLLGSGPTRLGAEIDWQLDFKSGRRWPDAHISQVPIVLGDGSDIKVPWELSRCQHLPLLAAAHQVSGDQRYQDELGAQLISFIAANPPEYGASWACTMDVAIRAANWVAALCLALASGSDEPWLEAALESLLLHCRFIRGHLECGAVRSNHYLSDVAGLLIACAPFTDSDEGRAWARWATTALEGEMQRQVRADGCDQEASIGYHRLVTELFVCGSQAAEALCPGMLSSAFHERLALMLGFVSNYTRPDGLAAQMGDADDGRFLPLATYGTDPRNHRHLFRQMGRPWRPGVAHAAYPDGGWYLMRHEQFWSAIRCGDVGLDGTGAHAHNDQLAFELAFGSDALVVDPGTYLYTGDPGARNEFRATAAHSSLSIGGAEQNRIPTKELFSLPEEAYPLCVRFSAEGPRARFTGEHSGFRELERSVAHRRDFLFDGAARIVEITDTVVGAQGLAVAWSFPLAPCAVSIECDCATAEFPGAVLEIEAAGAALAIAEGWLSPSYGRRFIAPVVRARATARSEEERFRFRLRVSVRS